MKNMIRIALLVGIIFGLNSCYFVKENSTTLEIQSYGELVVAYSIEGGKSEMIILNGPRTRYYDLPTKGTITLTVESFKPGDYNVKLVERVGKGAMSMFNNPIDENVLFSFITREVARKVETTRL